MNRGEWTWRIGAAAVSVAVVAVGALFLTTGHGVSISSTAAKPAVRGAANSSSHPGGAGAASGTTSSQGRGAVSTSSGGHVSGSAGSKSAASSRSHASEQQASPAASATSAANAVGSLFSRIDAQAPAVSAGTASGTGSTTGATAAGQSPAAGGALQAAIHSKSLKPSEAEIVQPYITQLESLRNQYLGSLSALYNQARADYHSGKGSKVAIEAKYMPKLVSLENGAQNQANSILFALRAQLQAHGYATTEVSVLQADYYSEVQQAIASFGK